MKITAKDLIIISFAAVIGLLAMFKLVDLLYIKDKSVYSDVFAFIGTIVGGVLSGAITLVGVRYTIIANREDDYIKDIPKRIQILSEIDLGVKKISDEINDIKQSSDKTKNYESPINLALKMYQLIGENRIPEKSMEASELVYKELDKTMNNCIDVIDEVWSTKDNSENIQTIKKHYNKISLNNVSLIIYQEKSRLVKEYFEKHQE